MTALARRFKRDTGDTFDLKAVIHLGIKRFFVLTAAFTTLRLTEVDATGQFADAQDIEAVSGDIGAQRAELFQPLVQFRWTQVAEQLEVFTQRQQRAALWLLVWRQIFPFRAAHGTKQNGVSLVAAFNGRLWQRFAVTVDGDAANVVMAGSNAHIKTLTHGFQYFQCLCHDFRANTVTW